MLRISDKRFVNEALIADVVDGINELNKPSIAVYFAGDVGPTHFVGAGRQVILAYLEANSSDWRRAGEEEAQQTQLDRLPITAVALQKRLATD